MYSYAYFLSNSIPFLGGVSSNYLGQTLSAKGYYYEHYKDSLSFSLVVSTASIIGSYNCVTDFYEKLSPLFLTTVAIINIGYLYNLYCLFDNVSNEVCMEDIRQMQLKHLPENCNIDIVGHQTDSILTQDFL